MMKKIIIPAIIARTQMELDTLIEKVKSATELIQLDIMDSKFVPNTSLDFDFKLLKKNLKFEAHLMIDDPYEWARDNGKKVGTLIAHIEATKNPGELIDIVKKMNRKIGFALNPKTPIERIDDYLDDLNQVLVLTVNPGFYGSPFLPDMLKKVEKLRNLKPNLNIEVDGGITNETINEVNSAGANMFVSGSYIMKADKPTESIKKLNREILKR